ncbi:hypothetical protein [Alienimonas chondri]|uniref:DUF3299 domain-containing protein n=1 Tax=Alienimonas chondri TaxID=2681879 RepID=A0ABX1VFM7_9PLAN|nr:hypothetical protein [Alienimonas chondri]NNJ26330.1 hypothetical protein [Alienimonas chondri]
MNRFALLFVGSIGGAALLAGCGPAEVGTAYSDAEPTLPPESGSTVPAALSASAADSKPPSDALPIGDGEPARSQEPTSEIELAAAEADEDGFDGAIASSAEEDDGFAGGFAPAPATVAADNDGFAGGFAGDDQPGMPEPTVDDSGEPRELKLLIPINSFSPAGDGTLRVSFDDLDLLKVLNAEPVPADVVDYFPDWLRDLDGQKITLRGFMYPTYADPVRAFILARDNQICCFGRNPKSYDLVTVKLAKGEESRYIQNRPFDVVGTFHLDPQRDGEDWLRLYRIDGARIVE